MKLEQLGKKANDFADLHSAGCFVIPNPWDAGSARMLESLGFSALATSSAGCAFARGLPDSAVESEQLLEDYLKIIEAALSTAANEIQEKGTFEFASKAINGKYLNKVFKQTLRNIDEADE